ncbi:NfeD family protein [Rhizobium glycinendophyticum]|uniref:NfeD family protein n=1 Tax=Rhizobium glycinendophyticum TaxID=2589807 RepID=A0A504UZE1_9HYPH|nr:NfeD family protein [Rhizobium glycinendophyticum]TPP12171.1 NfeD family protein [Rhizobium glycinendophyticum]
MTARIVTELGPWSWWVLGMLLLAAELLMPGVFLVWIGLAALATGALSLLLWDLAVWSWQVQALAFAFASVAFTLAGRRYYGRADIGSDEPLLNQRGASLVGRTATLAEPIREGRGRIRLDDTFWIVSGPDLAAGTRVRVVSSNGRDLTVEET